MSSHPFRLYLDADKTVAYTTGVTTTSTYLQIAVDEDTPNILYYQCSSHYTWVIMQLFLVLMLLIRLKP